EGGGHGHDAGWIPPGGGWPTPGEGQPGAVPPPWSGPEPGPSGWSATPPPGGPTFSPSPPPPPPSGRPPSNSALRTILIVGGVLGVAFVALIALVAVMIPSEDEVYGSAGELDEFGGFGPAPSIDLDAPPEVT